MLEAVAGDERNYLRLGGRNELLSSYDFRFKDFVTKRVRIGCLVDSKEKHGPYRNLKQENIDDLLPCPLCVNVIRVNTIDMKNM